MLAKLIYPVFICLCLTNWNDAARILGVFPMAAPSHYFLGNSLLRGLAEAGHDVTMVSPFVDKYPPKRGKWRDIELDGFLEVFSKMFNETDMFKMQSISPWITYFFICKMGNEITERTLNHTKVQDLLKSDEKFDVVIVGQFLNDAMKAFANHFNAHLILFSNTATNTWINSLVGNPSLPSFHPEVLLGLPKQMSFFQRLENTLFKFLFTLHMHILFYPAQEELIQKYFPKPTDINDILYNASLVLLNSHASIFDPQPLVPCMVEIGGYHIKPPKALPEDLQIYLDGAKEGVIYFSMGSNLQSKNLPVEKRDALLKAFSKRKEKILWKFEDEVLPGQPINVKLGKWLPQQDILAHPNVKVFITHGGLLSTTETVYHGVPIIAIPIAGDQKMNARLAEEAGYAITLNFHELSEETLISALEEITINPKYRDIAKGRSRIMRDRQVKPIDNAVYWVEYVIRHNGAKHLRVAYLDLPWYQYYLLDIFTFLIAVTILISIIGFLIFRKILFYIRRKKVDKKKLKTN